MEVWLTPNVKRPRGLKVWSCRSAQRNRRKSAPNLIVWLPAILVQILERSMFASERSQGRLALYPIIGLVKPPTLTPMIPLVNGLILTPGTPSAAGRGVVFSVIRLFRFVVVVHHACARFHNEAAR